MYIISINLNVVIQDIRGVIGLKFVVVKQVGKGVINIDVYVA